MTTSTLTLAEIASQPETWERAIAQGSSPVDGLPAAGERVLVLGCGTSYYVARAYAWLREAAGDGITDALIASELPESLRPYDRVVAISRSGASSDLITALARCTDIPVTVLLGEQGTPLASIADAVVDLSYADEGSVVQTRFPTSLLVMLRTSLGSPTGHLPEAARVALASELPTTDIDQLVVLGHGWGEAIATEGALKVRESAGAWAEAYAVGEYRHGPISVAGPRTLVWTLAPLSAELDSAIRQTGAQIEHGGDEPLTELIRLQRFAVALAARRGRDADRPHHLSRAVVLDH
jgi:fructoselysine-6-P-deglycase FrlB-like protein